MAEEEIQVRQRFGVVRLEEARPSSPSPEEGRRLVAAFIGIKNAEIRDAIVTFIQMVSHAYNDIE